ncbi:MAG: DUF4185 domain-containing protein [Myxococcales bacterium]|nr:DUF4185 domain-containing protein [Myxococcales bacterium]
MTDEALPTYGPCEPWGAGARGRIQTLGLQDGRAIVVAGSIARAGETVPNALLLIDGAPDLTNCLASVDTSDAVPGLDTAALPGSPQGEIQGMFLIGAEPYAYVRTYDGFEVLGTALATFDEGERRFVAAGEYLFADGPAFGEAVLTDDHDVYAFGCVNTGPFDSSCYLARVALDSVGDRGAYQFYRGSGGYTDDPDAAWPVFDGGSGLAVARDGLRLRAWFIAPLSDRIQTREGLAPAGPWSQPRDLARCSTADTRVLCGGVGVIAPPDEAGNVTLSYGAFSFEPTADELRATRVVTAPVPD